MVDATRVKCRKSPWCTKQCQLLRLYRFESCPDYDRRPLLIHRTEWGIIIELEFASVLELVDINDLGSLAVRCAGSSPVRGTNCVFVC